MTNRQSAPPRVGSIHSEAIPADLNLPPWVRAAPAPEPSPSRPLAPSRPSDPPPVRSPLGDDDGRQFRRGRLIHRLLQTLPDLVPGQREAAGRRFLARGHHGLAPSEQAALLTETLRVMGDPTFAALFGPDSQAEVPLIGRLGATVVAGQIDRLALTEDAVLILDFKTNRPPPLAVADVAPVYLTQLATYRALLRQIYPDRAVRTALLWTDRPSLMTVPDRLLDDYSAHLISQE